MRVSLLILQIAVHVSMVHADSSVLTCAPTDPVCKFQLNITAKLTMMDGDKLVEPKDGKLFHFGNRTLRDLSKVIQADGYYQTPRMVIVANGELPGPRFEVHTGQRVLITVMNHLISEGVTVHWHGVLQHESNYMDGVAFINQCPILPGQSFTYNFTVKHAGTDFYHAHIGAQRTQGLFGAFITKNSITGDELPSEDNDHIMVLNDWNHDYDSNIAHLKADHGIYNPDGTRADKHMSQDNSKLSEFRWHSGLVNGKGRYHYLDSTGREVHNEAPLEVFNITKGVTMRFRVISAGTMFPLRVSIDQHYLTMVSSDGYEFFNHTVESFILSPGERFDFLVTANQTSGSYWIFAETLEVENVMTGVKPKPRHRAEAILQYTDNPMPNTDYDNVVKDDSNKSFCTPSFKCRVLNCPFGKSFNIGPNQECTHLTDLVSKEEQTVVRDSDFKEKFFNFGFPGLAAINGRKWEYPSFPAASQKGELADVRKCDECSADKTCTCTHTEVLEGDKYYQFVLINNGIGSGYAHPIHLHGHNFQVVKEGFYPLDKGTGRLSNGVHLWRDMITCLGKNDSICNSAEWKDPAKYSGKNLNSQGVSPLPVLKDTVMVASGGYTVIRFKANNPGYWFMHCHIELHNLNGMAMLFNEASDNQIAPPPSFPICRSFPSKYGVTPIPPPQTTCKAATSTSMFSLISSVIVAFYFI